MIEQTTFGKYQLRERINVGGMAEVFLADVDDQENPVALKRVLPNISRNKEFISMFIDEARLSVQLNHGGIAQVLDAGQIDDSYFIALEHVDGKDLGAILKLARKQKQPMPLPIACYVATKVCEALHYAHNKKNPAGQPLELVHRDVSPSNLLISYTGDVKVTDFGLAKANGKATQTQAGIIKGKHGYMSPEQAQGQAIDRRSDIFSVGVCLYEMLTGQRLFKGESDFSTLQRVREADVPSLSTMDRRVPSELERIISKMLARMPSDRYATAEEVARDLQAFMADSGNLAGPRELSSYIRGLFSIDAGAKKLASKAPMGDGVTGLAAFDDIQPVSTVSALIDLPDAPPPMLMTEQNLPVEITPQGVKKIEKRAATLVGMPLPARTGDTVQQTPVFGGAAARSNTLPPPPAPRTSTTPPSPRVSASVPPPAPGSMRSSSTLPPPPAPRVSASVPPPAPGSMRSPSLPPPPAPRASMPPAPRVSHSIPPPAPLMAAGPSVQLDWPEEDLATSRLDDSGEFETAEARSADVTEQIEMPAHSVWEDDAPKTEAHTPVTFPKQGLSSTQKAIGVAAVALLLVGGAFALLRGPKLSALKLEVTPADATVLLDGQQLATASPYNIDGLDPTKPHTLEVRKAGYSVWSTEVQLQAGETMSLPSVTLDAEKKETGFALDSKPSGMKVSIDGKDTGAVTPVRLTDLPVGSHRIELSGKGVAPWATQLELAADQVVELPIAELAPSAAATEPAQGTLVASNDVAAEDEVAAPTRKLSARERRAAAKRAKAQARAARASAAASRRSTPRASARVASASTPAPKAGPAGKGGTGTLRINTQPWSNVFVDGRLIGNTPQLAIQLSPGRHRITLVNQGLGIRKLVEVNIVAGKTETKIIKLAP